MGKHYSGSTAASAMTHGAGPDDDERCELLGPGPGGRAKRVTPKHSENPSDRTSMTKASTVDDGEDA